MLELKVGISDIEGKNVVEANKGDNLDSSWFL